MINNIVPYKEGIINKISNWFKKIFFRRKDNQEVEEKNGVVFYSETLRDRVFIPEDKEKNRVLNLRKKWEEGEIDAEDIDENTPLQLSIKTSYVEITQILLERGANSNVLNY